jgi:hypothetical protein
MLGTEQCFDEFVDHGNSLVENNDMGNILTYGLLVYHVNYAKNDLNSE